MYAYHKLGMKDQAGDAAKARALGVNVSPLLMVPFSKIFNDARGGCLSST
jgi:hypothetical protein